MEMTERDSTWLLKVEHFDQFKRQTDPEMLHYGEEIRKAIGEREELGEEDIERIAGSIPAWTPMGGEIHRFVVEYWLRRWQWREIKALGVFRKI